MKQEYTLFLRSIDIFSLTHMHYCWVLAMFLIAGCTAFETDDPLEANLRAAGKNRKELEKVLDFYTDSADSLKYQAAEFLILHMDAQYTVDDPRTQEVVQNLARVAGMSEPRANQFMDSIHAVQITQATSVRKTRTSDLQNITAEYLIKNIDHAFDAWRNAPWYDQIDFITFCNYILPYNSGKAPVESWREIYHDAFVGSVNSKRQSGMLSVVDTLLTGNRPKFRYVHNLGGGDDFQAQDLLKLKAGKCYHWAHTVNYMLRDFAIPSVLIYAPHWATHPAGHAWNGVLDSADHIIPYAIEYNIPYIFNPMYWPLKTAKLYILPYSKNPASIAMQMDGSDIDIPLKLQDARMVDVTARFVPVIDLPVSITHASPSEQDVLFLCVFDRGAYNAVDWSRIASGGTTFTNVGKDVVYLPAFYNNKTYQAASEPMIVTYDGEIKSLAADTSEFQTIRLYRKYPINGSMFRYTEPFYGMKIQTSKDREFSLPIDKYDILRYPSPVITDGPKQRDRWRWEEYRDSVVFNPPLKSQYVRFLAAPRKECIVGEIECFDAESRIIKGIAYGSKSGAENIYDGTYGECFHDPDSLGWVAIDFGKEVSVSKIKYLPSNDSNSIQVGERYELSYFDRTWISLGVQTAQYKYLDYHTPANALLWLRNLDTGKEERVFTINEHGGQVWW